MSVTNSPAYEDIALDAGIEATLAVGAGLETWWWGLVGRAASPMSVASDIYSWWQIAADRQRPEWHLPHTIAFEEPIARLRDFSTGGDRDTTVPTLVLPPQAGHDSCIVDYSPTQSQIRTILDAGLTRTFSMDWVGATHDTRDATIEDYIAAVHRAVDHAGGRVNLIGDCQGGWLATVYAALHPERVNTLTIAGAPIDFHAGEPAIGAALEWLAPRGDLSFYRSLVASGGGVLKGEHMLNSFIALKPDNEVSRQLALLNNVRDDAHVARYRRFEDWFKHVQDIPGAFYLWIVERLFRDNALIAGTLEVGGSRVDLSRITCPLNLLAGSADHITPPAQVYALADHASTPARHVTKRLSSAGHLGLFMGQEALSEHWPALLAEVARVSQPTEERFSRQMSDRSPAAIVAGPR